jgi:hypothetical protein
MADFAKRLHDKVLEMSNEEWEELPEVAQLWTNDTTKSFEDDGLISDELLTKFEEEIKEEPDEAEEENDEEEADAEEEEAEGEKEEEHDEDEDEDEDEDQPEEESEDEEEPVKAATARKKMKAKAPAKPVRGTARKVVAKKAKGNARGNGARRPIGAQYKIKELLLKNPKMSVEDLLEKLAPLGFKPTRTAVASIRSGFRHSLKVIMDKGGIPKNTEL